MKILRTASLFSLLGLGLACETGGTRRPMAAAPNAGSATVPMPLAEQVRQLAVTSAPGPRHAALSGLEGDWDVTLSNASADGTEGEAFHGTANLVWVLGGRFLRWDATLDFGGVPGRTTGFLGFDSLYSEYQLMMISDLSQGMEVARGAGDVHGSGLVFTLDQLDPRNGKKVRARSRLRLIDHDHFVLEQIEAEKDGEDRVVRVSRYHRAAAREHKT